MKLYDPNRLTDEEKELVDMGVHLVQTPDPEKMPETYITMLLEAISEATGNPMPPQEEIKKAVDNYKATLKEEK